VPSLSNVAMRAVGGTNSVEPSLVARRTKSTMDAFAGRRFHDGSGSGWAAASLAVTRTRQATGPHRHRRAMAHDDLRRLRRGLRHLVHHRFEVEAGRLLARRNQPMSSPMMNRMFGFFASAMSGPPRGIDARR